MRWWRRQWHPTPVLLPGKSHGWKSLVGCSPWGRWGLDTTEWLHFHALEKEIATHSSVLAWRIPGTVEPGGLPSMGSHRVRRNWSDLAAALPLFGLSFYFLDSVFWFKEVFTSDELQLFFFFYHSCFYWNILGLVANEDHKYLCLGFLLRVL